MSRRATVLTHIAAVALLAFGAASAWAQASPDWYHAGNSLVDLSLAGLASGPVDRIWYSPDGGTLYALTSSGKTFETSDFESWKPSQAAVPAPADLSSNGTILPEQNARLKGFNGQRSTMYAFGAFVYRSQDGGSNWDNLTEFRSRSIIGGGVRDLAVSPRDPQEVTAATGDGVFRTLDGGKTWSGLNESLPNLPAQRLWAVPSGDRGAQIEISGNRTVEWQPGEKQAWRLVDNRDAQQEAQLRAVGITAFARPSSSLLYTGSANGTINVYTNSGATLQSSLNGGTVERFWVDPADSRIALAVLGARPANAVPGVPASHVFHTVDGGAHWDDITNDLPDAAVHGVTASRTSGAIYVATDAGVFYTRSDVGVLSVPSGWQKLTGLPQAAVSDVRLDAGENQLWAAVSGFGVYSTLAPHRLGDPAVVSAADLIRRAAAPGSLLSVRGAKVSSALAGNLAAPVLATTDTESQIQIPFEVSGQALTLEYAPVSGRSVAALLPLAEASPGILVGGDGTPMLVDATTGTMLDSSNPAHSRARIQILATGLGRVNPDWPAGKPAPADNPPQVVATVTAFLNRNPVTITRATLLPGYTGVYMVEIEMPKLVNYGPSELSIEAGGNISNPVRVYIEP